MKVRRKYQKRQQKNLIYQAKEKKEIMKEDNKEPER